LNRLILTLILLVNSLRFIGLESAPPGFYVDEAVGSAQVMCLKQTGADLFNSKLPLFSPGLGAGYYTAPYLYGSAIWTSIFGNSTSAFRSFAAFITCMTIALIYLWVRRKTNTRIALIAALLASVSPWAFQFSRIAWDPPLAPFFMMLGLNFFESKKRWNWFAGTLAFSLASYSYPASRIQMAPLLFLIPGMTWKTKFKSFALYLILLGPLIFRPLLDPRFTARAKMLVLWSTHPMNPYLDAGIMELVFAFFKNMLLHFTPDFLLLAGDRNLRHSIQTSGMMSVAEWAILAIAVVFFIWKLARFKKPAFDQTVVFLTIGALLGIAPAALTWESVPHALRAIGAWPFFILLAAWLFGKLNLKQTKIWTVVLILLTVLFSTRYLMNYFFEYPQIASNWFQTEHNRLGDAYDQMTKQGILCKTLQEEMKNGSF